jgi:hypothetical protein
VTERERISISKLLDMANRARYDAQQMKAFITERGLLEDFERSQDLANIYRMAHPYRVLGTDQPLPEEREYLGYRA